MNFSFGSDPEFVLTKGGKYYSAIGIVKNSVYNDNEYYYDNVMAECSIRPSNSKEEAIDTFRDCFKYYAKLVYPYKLVPQASQMYTKDQLSHADAREVGCKGEYCAYRLEPVENKTADRYIKKTNFRSAGGHVHLGQKILQCDGFMQVFTIRMLDLFLGLPLIFIDKDPTAAARRQIYGQAGRHRKPAHGLEYRTPGNYWLISPELVGLVYDTCDFVLDFVQQQRHYELWHVEEDVFTREDWYNAHKCHGYNIRELRNAIDKTNCQLGKKFLEFIESYLTKDLQKSVSDAINAKHYDFYKEWSI